MGSGDAILDKNIDVPILFFSKSTALISLITNRK